MKNEKQDIKIIRNQMNIFRSLPKMNDHIFFIENLKDVVNLQQIREGFNALILCETGSMKALIGESFLVEVRQGEILLVPIFKTVRLINSENPGNVNLLIISDQAMSAVLGNQFYIWSGAMYVKECYVVTLDDVVDVLKSLGRIIIGKQDVLSEEIAFVMLRTLLLLICRELLETKVMPETGTSSTSREKDIFNQFIKLISQQEQKHNEVSFYSDQLNITSKYLALVCKHVSGKSPIMWIRQSVMEDCCTLLRNTNMSVKEISFRMGFANPSFFGQYFKKSYRRYSR